MKIAHEETFAPVAPGIDEYLEVKYVSLGGIGRTRWGWWPKRLAGSGLRTSIAARRR
jgi:hypothetical protein